MKKIFTRFVIFALLIALNAIAATFGGAVGCGGGGDDNNEVVTPSPSPSPTPSSTPSSSPSPTSSPNGSGYLNVTDVLKYGVLKIPAEAGVTSKSPYVFVKLYLLTSYSCPSGSKMSSILAGDVNQAGVGFLNSGTEGLVAYQIGWKYPTKLSSDKTTFNLLFREVSPDGSALEQNCNSLPYKSTDDKNILNFECSFSLLDSYQDTSYEDKCKLVFKYKEDKYIDTTNKLFDVNAVQTVFVPYFYGSVVQSMIEDPTAEGVFWLGLDDNPGGDGGEKLIKWETKGTLTPNDDVTTDFTSSVSNTQVNVYQMKADSTGGIWFALSAGDVGVAYKSSSGQWKKYSLIDKYGGEKKTIRSIAIRSDGTPCFGESSVFCFKNNVWQEITVPFGSYSLEADSLNGLYVGTLYWGMYYIDGSNKVTELNFGIPEIDSGSIQDMEIADNVLFIGTYGDGLYAYDLNEQSLIASYSKYNEGAEPIGGDNVEEIYGDDVAVWLGLYGFGLGYLDAELKYNDFSSLGSKVPDACIHDIIKDKSGRIWTACNGVKVMEEMSYGE